MTRQAITNRELWELLREFVPHIPKHWSYMKFVLMPDMGFVKWVDQYGHFAHEFSTMEAIKLGGILVEHHGLPAFSPELSVTLQSGPGIPELNVKMYLSRETRVPEVVES